MQRTKCQECRKTYYCVVVQGMRWCFCFVSCHKWSILDVLFPVKTIESCSSGASTSGVDIFRGGGLYLFYNLFHSCENLCGRKPECVRAEEGFLRCCELCLHASAPVWHLMRTQTFNSTLRLSISVLLWWSVIKRATRSRTFLHSGTHFFLESRIFSILCPPPLTSCSSYYLSCLYMWKTEQQTAASIFRPASAELDFPPFPQRLWETARCSLTEGAKESPTLCFQFMSWSGHKTSRPGRGFPLTIITHEQCSDMCTVTVGHSVTVSVRNVFSFPSYRKDVWTPKLSSEVCVCSSTLCVCLIALRPWWVAVLT